MTPEQAHPTGEAMADVIEDLKAQARIRRQAKSGTRGHHLSELARELGFGWPHLVAVLTGRTADDFGTLLYPRGGDVHWNI